MRMFVSRIWIYPIKSLDGVEVASARITTGGVLEHDRAFAILDGDGRLVNGKRTPRVHALRSAFSDDFAEVEFWTTEQPRRRVFELADVEPCERWLADFFGFPIALLVDRVHGFPDDGVAPGPTIVSEGSLEEVGRWFPELPSGGMRARFRSNIELRGGEAFEEDRLFGAPGEAKPFRIGTVNLLGTNPCQRCAVPTRDPESGETVPGFQKRFAEQRARTLPPWADVSQFNHFYRLAVNTMVPVSEAGKWIRVGDSIGLE
jgi:uncharacterized protein YcbX